MKENLRVRVGAVVLALATLAAVIFAWLNFVQRSRYDIVDDGVAWTDSSNGIEAWKVAAGSPASMAGYTARGCGRNFAISSRATAKSLRLV